MTTEAEKKIISSKKQVPLLWAFVTTVLSCVLLTATSIGFTIYKIQEDKQQWCELITYYDDFYTKNPPKPESPNYEIQKKNAELMHNRRINLGCKPTIK